MILMQRKIGSEKGHIRENYEAPSSKFQDWVFRIGLSKTPIARFFVMLQERFYLKQLLFVVFFSITLAFLINFQFETHFDYQVGDIAKRDIVSPVSIDIIDEATTEQKRIEAQSNTPIILDYDPLVFDRVSSSVFRSFRLMRSKLKGLAIPKGAHSEEIFFKEFLKYKGEFEREIGFGTSDYLFDWWVEKRFSAKLENALIRSLEHWYQGKVTDGADKYIPPKTTVVLARSISKAAQGREFHIRTEEIRDITNIEQFEIKEFKGSEKFASEDLQVLTRFARNLMQPNLTLNKQEMENRKQQARDAVLPIHLAIKKNQIIVAEGNPIQPIHMALMKEIETRKSGNRKDILAWSMAFLLVVVIIMFFKFYTRLSGGKLIIENRDIVVMGLIVLGVIFSARFTIFIVENSMQLRFGMRFPNDVLWFLAPMASGPILVALLIGSGEVIWVFTAFIAIVAGLVSEFNFQFMVITLVGGITGARSVLSCKKRNDIYVAGIKSGLVGGLIAVLLLIVTHLDREGFYREVLMGGSLAFVSGILSSVLVMIFIPVLESVFNYTTDVKLLELSNLNHPLLKEMIVKAPGTYHHSMLVGSMVEAAAEEIGANPLLGKVMCYYHDIGKIAHARYFIENQKPGQNPHDHISPYMSRTLLVAHVKDGVELGMEHKLGKPIIDGVLQHHGTTVISYFYNKAIDLKEEASAEIVEEEFRYPGPKPQFSEAALCMLADSIEAASRSLDEPTPVRLQNIVRNIVQKKFLDGQLDECSLTLRDLSKVENAFTRILLGIYHQRIDYPRSSG